jgi:hypothetical protein
MTVRVARLLCASPQQHAIASVAYESANGEPAVSVSRELVIKFVGLILAEVIQPVCSICGALIVIPPEDSATDFATMHAALQSIEAQAKAEELQNRRLRERAARN